jgi:hypothetical protein
MGLLVDPGSLATNIATISFFFADVQPVTLKDCVTAASRGLVHRLAYDLLAKAKRPVLTVSCSRYCKAS